MPPSGCSKSGALDVTMQPIMMKKGRPGTLLRVIAQAGGSRGAGAASSSPRPPPSGVRIYSAERRVQRADVHGSGDAVRQGARESLERGRLTRRSTRTAASSRIDTGVAAEADHRRSQLRLPEPNKMKYYLTTPIYYVNAAPHIGHAYTTMAADTDQALQAHAGLRRRADHRHRRARRERGARRRARRARRRRSSATSIAAEFREQWEMLGSRRRPLPCAPPSPQHAQGGAGAVRALPRERLHL